MVVGSICSRKMVIDYGENLVDAMHFPFVKNILMHFPYVVV